MAKKSSIARNEKRKRLVSKYFKKRLELKMKLKNPKISDEDFYLAQRTLSRLPRNSSSVRLRNRCSITGRARSYKRNFGVSRITFRELALKGEIPGVTKSSW